MKVMILRAGVAYPVDRQKVPPPALHQPQHGLYASYTFRIL
jgi:hypothetical protein